jgi:hypothetical protein
MSVLPPDLMSWVRSTDIKSVEKGKGRKSGVEIYAEMGSIFH